MARNTRPISWVRAARRDFEDFPAEAQLTCQRALTIVAEGRMPDIAKPLKGFGSGVLELALRYRGDAYRIVYAVQLGADVWVIHAFQKKSKTGHQDAPIRARSGSAAAEPITGDVAMTDEPLEVIRGSGNVFRDFGSPDADREQLRAILAARIIGVLDDRHLSVRDAHALTGIAAADFSRIRRVNLERFTIDRLMTILSRLGQEVEVSVTTRQRARAAE
jgi:phage-related protein/predicted XRE-type DNA-binding protein